MRPLFDKTRQRFGRAQRAPQGSKQPKGCFDQSCRARHFPFGVNRSQGLHLVPDTWLTLLDLTRFRGQSRQRIPGRAARDRTGNS
jgi:hypothetical protein